MSALSNVTESTGGKVAIIALVLVAVGLLGYEAVQMSSSGQSRDVPAKVVVSDAQKTIDAINKMTNLTDAQKQGMIAHEQAEIDKANGKAGPSGRPGMPTGAAQGGQ